jgi:hypothetical protein
VKNFQLDISLVRDEVQNPASFLGMPLLFVVLVPIGFMFWLALSSIEATSYEGMSF